MKTFDERLTEIGGAKNGIASIANLSLKNYLNEMMKVNKSEYVSLAYYYLKNQYSVKNTTFVECVDRVMKNITTGLASSRRDMYLILELLLVLPFIDEEEREAL